MALAQTEDIWHSYKELKSIVWKYLNQELGSDLPSADFENILRRHKQNFFNLLQNPPKSSKKREELKNAMVDGIYLKGIGHQIITEDLYQESVILSDMYNMNELVALDLLCTAQLQMPSYPGLARGLVAILLYYDGQKALLTSLLYLVQARNGVQWSLNVKPELSRFITDYTDQLMEGGIFKRILELLRILDLTAEIEKLQDNLALGGPRHRREVTDLFNDIRVALADIMFSWSIQSGLPKNCTLALMNFLKQATLDTEATGIIDDVTLYLEMALLSAFDLSIFHTREDGEEVVQSLPILSDTTLITSLVAELLNSSPKWVCEGLQALTMFAMAVSLASLRVLPQNYIFQDAINKEDTLVDMSIEMNVFSFLHNIVLENKTLYKEQYLYNRMHNLLTDFVVHMYPKAKDLRMKANEVARTLQVYIREDLEAPGNLPRYFEFLLLSIGKFYSKNTVDPELTMSWWSPIELNSNKNLNIRIAPRSVALFKFLKLSGDMLPATLFVPFLKMLSGLSSTPETAKHCFNMLKQAGTHLSRTLSWDHFFLSFGQYYHNLRQETPPQIDTIYRLRTGYHKGVSPQELEGLHAVLLLIRTVAEHDPFARVALCEHPVWSPLGILLGLVSCSVPILLKADLLQTLAVLSQSIANASQMWENLESSQIIVTIHTTSSYAPRGIQTELDEIESRMEEYPLTRGVLQLLNNLTVFGIPKSLGAGTRNPSFDPYLSFIINSVFLTYNSRGYRDSAEKYEVALLCLKLFEKFLRCYVPKAIDFPTKNANCELSSHPGYHLMVQFNNKTETLSVILDILNDGIRLFDTYVSFHGEERVQECTLACLNIILRTLKLQNRFFMALTETSTTVILNSISKLLLSINRRSGRPDHCINIAKYISYQRHMPKHALVAVQILVHITGTATSHSHFMNILTSTHEKEELLIKGAFFQCLDSNIDDIETANKTKNEILNLLKQCMQYPAPNLTHFLIGFELTRDISKMDFQYPGVMGFSRTCLHSLLSILDSTISKIVEPPPVMITESAYHLLYILASNSKTRGPILRFVRLNKLFFPCHLKQCKTLMRKDPKCLMQMSWLLKTLAVELKTASTTKQVTYLKFLISFLGNMSSSDESNQDNMFLHQILQIEVHESKDIPDIADISTIPESNPKLLKKHASDMKLYNEACAAVVEFADAWCQVAEVLVTFMPLEILDAKEQQVFSIHLLLYLLKKVVRSQLLTAVARYLSGSVLLIMDNIKRYYLKERRHFNVLVYYLGPLKEILESLVQWIMTSDVVDGELRINLYAALVTFLQLISSIQSEPPKVSVSASENLYVALLDGSRHHLETQDNDVTISTDLLGDFGDKLMAVVCHDCIGGQEICKILAMSSFSHLMTLSGNVGWQSYLSGHGFLKHIIQSLLDGNDELRTMLEPGGENAKALYLYSAKVLLLVRLAGSKVGAQMILEQNLLGVFSKMNVFSSHPEISKIWHNDALTKDKFLPSPDVHYLQIFLPTLEICNAILTTLGTENQSAVGQIMFFLISHLDVVELILRSGDTALSATYLKELALLTSVISRTANNDLINVLENPNLVCSNRAHLYRVQRLMLNLIPKFLLSEENVKTLLMHPDSDTISFQTSDRLLYGLQIAANLLWYPRNVIANNDVEHGEVGVLFYPSLYDPQLHSLQNKSIGHTNEQEPSLGSIVQQLLHTVNYQHQGKVTLDLLTRKINEIPDMNSMDLKPLIEDHMDMYDLEVKRERAYEIISEKLAKKKREMEYCALIIENSLYVIWAHLDYFLLRAVPNPRSTTYIHPVSNASGTEVFPSGHSDPIAKVSTEIVTGLKQGLVALFNDSFSKRLLETSQDRPELDRGFIDALLRKIKRLVQFVRVR
ncbi:nuclear pore complex protein Nup205 [Euwallacea similis]|uniref:nuclear pore complex protein Nup205 n=1 Tax=Euwallacea similis TaxID=1736056 RepID=UPI00345044D2